jgi:putative ABC transport system permease protein
MMRDAFGQSVAAILSNPLRSSLGALAVAVAVGTIVIVITALDGVRLYAEATTARTFGANTFLIAQVAAPGRVSRLVLQEQLQRNPPIRRSDTAFMTRHAEGLVLYAPNAQARASVSSGNKKLDDAAITGTTTALERIRDLNIVDGRFFTADEDRGATAVAVIGADVADALFPYESPLGKPIRIAGRRFEVIGVQGRIGSAGAGSQDRYVWMPLLAYERAFGAPRSLQIFAAPVGRDAVAAEDRARASLRARRALRPGATDNFDVLTPDASRGFVASLSQRIGAAAAPISLMALLAAIVVVTNTVLVSVSQRTREIGIRRALGARRSQILGEVLSESVLVATGGGVAGVAGAVVLMLAAAAIVPIPLIPTPPTVLTALAAAAGSGIAAGWYPALRATRLDVIAALRSE